MFKKLLSIVGTGAVVASATTPFISQTKSYESEFIKQEYKSEVSDFTADFVPTKFMAMISDYNSLSTSNKKIIAAKLDIMDTMTIDVAKNYLSNINIKFIHDYRNEILDLFNSFVIKPRNNDLQSELFTNIDWKQIERFISIDFTNSNDFSIDSSTYGPSHWWTALWDWGYKFEFGGGIINIERVALTIYNAYGFDFDQLISTLKVGDEILRNMFLPKESYISIDTFSLLIKKFQTQISNSGLPVTKYFNQIIDTASALTSMLISQGAGEMAVTELAEYIQEEVSNQFGINVEDLRTTYNDISKIIWEMTDTLNQITLVIDKMYTDLPDFIVDFILGSFVRIAKQMIAAENHSGNGVYIKFQKFIFPQGFKGR
ncbi:hypothetical protein SCLARK_001881 [Spiroplasma clarkii]|uniref:Uncharacterized protein n=1 Tax=Spiroplasma clarkii TaxID=2139 RepID=A0A1Y0L2R8_9MOLU|nr:hypothetical protein [Spiroplasma clarkii]ARU92311.1 hypothetical protein SCLARK_001881 [Spiroplasma clarkii]ATX71621.1 hypothetical protein SCLAR_v1c13230 [Spiroplasma clarkii]